MIEFEKELAEILNKDPLGLLVRQLNVSTATTADERLVASFEEINAFIDDKKQVPAKGRDMGERRLASRLEGIHASPEKAALLLTYDRHDLLAGVVLTPVETPATSEISSIEEVLANDALGLLDPNNEEAVAEDIFTLKYVAKQQSIPEHVAKRTPCEEFDQFELIFKQANADLLSGVKKVVPFNSERQIGPGSMFILQGLMVFRRWSGEIGEA